MPESNRLREFVVELAIYGISEEKDPRVDQELETELGFRPHIVVKRINWDKKDHRIIVQLIAEGISSNMVSRQMTEELFEVANAILNSVEGMHVNVLSVYLIE